MQPSGACRCTTHRYHHGTIEISTESTLSVRQGTWGPVDELGPWVKGLEPRVGGCHHEGLERAPHLPAGDASSQMSIHQLGVRELLNIPASNCWHRWHPLS